MLIWTLRTESGQPLAASGSVLSDSRISDVRLSGTRTSGARSSGFRLSMSSERCQVSRFAASLSLMSDVRLCDARPFVVHVQCTRSCQQICGFFECDVRRMTIRRTVVGSTGIPRWAIRHTRLHRTCNWVLVIYVQSTKSCQQICGLLEYVVKSSAIRNASHVCKDDY